MVQTASVDRDLDLVASQHVVSPSQVHGQSWTGLRLLGYHGNQYFLATVMSVSSVVSWMRMKDLVEGLKNLEMGQPMEGAEKTLVVLCGDRDLGLCEMFLLHSLRGNHSV